MAKKKKRTRSPFARVEAISKLQAAVKHYEFTRANVNYLVYQILARTEEEFREALEQREVGYEVYDWREYVASYDGTWYFCK